MLIDISRIIKKSGALIPKPHNHRSWERLNCIIFKKIEPWEATRTPECAQHPPIFSCTTSTPANRYFPSLHDNHSCGLVRNRHFCFGFGINALAKGPSTSWSFRLYLSEKLRSVCIWWNEWVLGKEGPRYIGVARKLVQFTMARKLVQFTIIQTLNHPTFRASVFGV